MRQILKSVLVYSFKVLAVTACGFISVFVLASGYESVYNRSLPYVHTLDGVNLSAVAQAYDLPSLAKTDSKKYGKFGKPGTLKFSGAADSTDGDAADVRLDIGEPILENNEWLARATTLHAIIPADARKGNISTLMLYCRSSFRTINGSNLPAIGANIFIDTDQKWRYVYKVTSARVYAQSDVYLPSSSSTTGKLLVVCNDSAKGINAVLEADLLSVQGSEL